MILGVLLKDWIRYERILNGRDKEYLTLKNRRERLGDPPFGTGYVCLWPFTSRLHAPMVWPYLGEKMLRLTLNDSLFIKEDNRNKERIIDISIIIGHRGFERLPLLLCTLKYIAGQCGVGIECIVVEQDSTSLIREALPIWVDYYWQSTVGGGYNRSSAFNYGASKAKGRILLLHDNDMIVPASYCREIVDIINSGYDAVNPKRFVYYLSREHTESIIDLDGKIVIDAPDYIVQNLEAGGSVAITKEAYARIGGMDESFVGWGGEDNEFWWRCAELKRWIWGFACIIHLWHKSQPMKEITNNENIGKAKALMDENRQTRIKDLVDKRLES